MEPPEGDPLRRWSASGAEIKAGDDGALFSFLACSKHSVVVDPENADDVSLLRSLLTGADAVVWSHGSAIVALDEFAPAALADAYAHLTVTSITPFGLEGPWAEKPATEFTLQAWSGGVIGLGRGAQDRAPLFVAGQIGEWLAGAFAAAGTMAVQSGLVDVSMLEAQILCLTYYSVSFFDALGRPFRDRRRLTIPGVATAADGLVALGCGTAQQWFDLCAMTGHEEWIDEESELSITEQANIHAEQLYEWVRENQVDDILDLSTAFRIPNAPVGNGANVTSFDQFVERGAFVSNPRDGFTQPGPPYRTTPSLLRAPQPAPRLGEHTDHYRSRARSQGRESARVTTGNVPLARGEVPPISLGPQLAGGLPFEGLRVLDMTSFWAGPSCTHVLAQLGAEVIHVESTARPDGTRLIAGVPVTEDQWWERSPIFSGLNTNKKSVTLDIRKERGVELLRSLVKTCDVIVENYTPRVLDQIGLDFDMVHQLRPDAIMMRMPGFGLDGPWRDKPAFAYVIEDASGITWLTGHPDQNPVEPYAVGDPNAGVHGLNALMLALAHRRRTGEGVRIEAAMVDAALNVAAEQVIEHSAYGNLLQREGNRGPTAAPQNLYRTSELDEFGRPDDWVAIAVATDGQWTNLVAALGRPAWASDDELASVAGRRRRHDAIDEHLSRWCATRTGDEIVQTLWDAGVPVAKVMQPHRVGDLPQIIHRGFYEQVDHPVNPTARHSTLPMRISTGPQHFHQTPAPLLGQHNREVLSGLGLGEDEIAELEAQGIIGRSPAMHGIRTTKTG